MAKDLKKRNTESSNNNAENLKESNSSISSAANQSKENSQNTLQSHSSIIQRKSKKNGLPNNLKLGIESLSGHSMDDVKVNYNSSKPSDINAHAYAQGSNIHLSPGQEKHLPHEAWHVAQQKQGRVKPTKKIKGKFNVNDNEGLEREADKMGEKAIQMKSPLNLDEKNINDTKSEEVFQLNSKKGNPKKQKPHRLFTKEEKRQAITEKNKKGKPLSHADERFQSAEAKRRWSETTSNVILANKGAGAFKESGKELAGKRAKGRWNEAASNVIKANKGAGAFKESGKERRQRALNDETRANEEEISTDTGIALKLTEAFTKTADFSNQTNIKKDNFNDFTITEKTDNNDVISKSITQVNTNRKTENNVFGREESYDEKDGKKVKVGNKVKDENLDQISGHMKDSAGIISGVGTIYSGLGNLFDTKKRKTHERAQGGLGAVKGTADIITSSTNIAKRVQDAEAAKRQAEFAGNVLDIDVENNSNLSANELIEQNNLSKPSGSPSFLGDLANTSGLVSNSAGAASSLVGFGGAILDHRQDDRDGKYKTADKEDENGNIIAGVDRSDARRRAHGRIAGKGIDTLKDGAKLGSNISNVVNGTASAASGVMGVVGGGLNIAGGLAGMGKAAHNYKLSNNRQKNIKAEMGKENVDPERMKQLEVMNTIMKKRKRNAKISGFTNALDTAAGAAAISGTVTGGAGTAAGAILGGVSTTIKGARAGGKAFKQWGRDRNARHHRKEEDIKADRIEKRQRLNEASRTDVKGSKWFNPLRHFSRWNAKRQLNKYHTEGSSHFKSDDDYAKDKFKKYEDRKGGIAERFEGLFNKDRSTKKKDEEADDLVEHLMNNPDDAKMFTGNFDTKKFAEMNEEEQKKFLKEKVKKR